MESSVPSVFEIASDFTVIRRAAIMAIIVGTILVSINHYNCCLLRGGFGSVCMTKAILTFFVPYAVSTISSIQAVKCEAMRRASKAS